MKTLADLEDMKKAGGAPFENAYECFIRSLENYYIAKSNGTERIKHELSNWDQEARVNIVKILIDRIQQSGMMYFNPNDLKRLM